MIKSTFSILFLIRKSRLGKSGESPIGITQLALLIFLFLIHNNLNRYAVPYYGEC